MAHSHEHHCESCSHKHEHHHEEHDLKKQLWLIGITVVLLIGAVLVEKNLSLSTWQLLLVYLIPYLIIGHETLGEAWEGIREGDAFNEHFLMSIATIGALCIGFLPGAETEFPEAVFVMLFFQVGELPKSKSSFKRSEGQVIDLFFINTCELHYLYVSLQRFCRIFKFIYPELA